MAEHRGVLPLGGGGLSGRSLKGLVGNKLRKTPNRSGSDKPKNFWSQYVPGRGEVKVSPPTVMPSSQRGSRGRGKQA